MQVTAFVGSHRKDGLVSRMCQKTLQGAEENGATTELVNLYDYKVNYCIGCWKCYSRGECFQADDFDTLFEKVKASDVMVLGSPTQMGNVSAIMKNFFDRHTGYAIYNPSGAPELHELPFIKKIRTFRRELKKFGPRDERMRGKKFILVATSTLPFPYSAITGQTRAVLGALESFVVRMGGKVLSRVFYTDTLLRFMKGKEQRMMKKAYNAGRKIKGLER